jgi:ATP-dependent RNA helicase DDX27
MADDEYVMTIDSDEEQVEPKQSAKYKVKDADEVQLDLDFVFDPSGDPYADVLEVQADLKDFIKGGSRPVRFLCIILCPL